MNELTRTAITSLEVAKMVDKRHADLLKNIQILNCWNLSVGFAEKF